MHERNINISHINVGVWTTNNGELRKKMLKYIDSELICMNETHLQGDTTIYIEGFTFYGHNRHSTHIRAPKGSGGVSIFVRNDLFPHFNISILDKSYDGILGISIISKETLTPLLYSAHTYHWNRQHGVAIQQDFSPIY